MLYLFSTAFGFLKDGISYTWKDESFHPLIYTKQCIARCVEWYIVSSLLFYIEWSSSIDTSNVRMILNSIQCPNNAPNETSDDTSFHLSVLHSISSICHSIHLSVCWFIFVSSLGLATHPTLVVGHILWKRWHGLMASHTRRFPPWFVVLHSVNGCSVWFRYE